MVMTSTSFLWVGFVPFIVMTLWLYTAFMAGGFPTLRNKRIALVIAHPDDEAMFFSPTVIALTDKKLENSFRILCFSSGDADGLGETRKKELVASALRLGLTSSEDVVIIESKDFPDSMSASWDSKLLTNTLMNHFAPAMPKLSPNKEPETLIDTIITFDSHGISSHPNHKSLYLGCREFIKTMMRRHSGWDSPISMYTLTTTNFLRKYTGIFDCIFSVLDNIFARKVAGDSPSPLWFVSWPEHVARGQRAMTISHKSQMVWFRYGWIYLSRYMIINNLNKEKIR